MSFDNVVSSRVFITDGTKFQEMNKVYQTYFPKDPPARATVVAPLMGPQYQVEITLTASRLPKQAFTTPAADGTPGKPSADPEQRHQGRQPALCVGHPRQQRRRTRATPKRRRSSCSPASAARSRPPASTGRNVVDGIVYITDVKNFDAMNTRLSDDLHQGLPGARHGPHGAGQRRRAGRDHVRRGQISRVHTDRSRLSDSGDVT